jgi:hypothetical protein
MRTSFTSNTGLYLFHMLHAINLILMLILHLKDIYVPALNFIIYIYVPALMLHNISEHLRLLFHLLHLYSTIVTIVRTSITFIALASHHLFKYLYSLIITLMYIIYYTYE